MDSSRNNATLVSTEPRSRPLYPHRRGRRESLRNNALLVSTEPRSRQFYPHRRGRRGFIRNNAFLVSNEPISRPSYPHTKGKDRIHQEIMHYWLARNQDPDHHIPTEGEGGDSSRKNALLVSIEPKSRPFYPNRRGRRGFIKKQCIIS